MNTHHNQKLIINSLVIFLINLRWSVNAQKCVPSGGGDRVICSELESLAELSREMSPNWLNIAVVNQRGSNFAVAEHEARYLNTVEKLDLSQAGRLIMSDHGFKEFRSLRHLNISGGYVPMLKVSYFLPQATIDTLDASWNSMRILTRNMLENLSNLRVANFSHNQLDTVQSNSFETLTQLEYLALNDNLLKQIDFGELKRLQYLSLSDNLIEVLPSNGFRNMPLLQTLVITSNSLRKIEDRAFLGMNELKVLNISGNNLDNLTSNIFMGSSRVKINNLDLSLNNIRHLPAGIFQHLNSLQYLDISGNKLSKLNAESFNGLRAMRKLSASNNEIVEIGENTFANMPSLDSVDLSSNNLVTLSGSVFGTTTLSRFRKLLLTQNNLKTLDPLTFSALPNLEYLSLGYNEISKLDIQMFEPLKRLRKLHLGHNQIEEIPANVLESFDGLQELLINYNKLTFLPDVIAEFPRLTKVFIEGNPWQCHCLDDLVDWMSSRKIQYIKKSSFFDGRKPICVVTPASVCVKDIELVRKHHIVDIFEGEMSSDEDEGYID